MQSGHPFIRLVKNNADIITIQVSNISNCKRDGVWVEASGDWSSAAQSVARKVEAPCFEKGFKMFYVWRYGSDSIVSVYIDVVANLWLQPCLAKVLNWCFLRFYSMVSSQELTCIWHRVMAECKYRGLEVEVSGNKRKNNWTEI